MINIGFVGAGNMGGAIISGMVKSKNFDPDKIFVYDKKVSDEIAELKTTCVDHFSLVRNCDVIVLAVKPNVLQTVAECILATGIDISDKIFISIAAGSKNGSIVENA